jgi:hypothetical protein
MLLAKVDVLQRICFVRVPAGFTCRISQGGRAEAADNQSKNDIKSHDLFSLSHDTHDPTAPSLDHAQ